jgi:hypothetical protein
MLAELRLAYTRLEDNLGELDALACSQAFSGQSWAHVDPQTVRNFTEMLREFPLSASRPPRLECGNLFACRGIDRCNLRIVIAPHNSRGILLVSVDLTTLSTESPDRDQQHSVTIRFLTDYSAVGQFAADLEALLNGILKEAILKTSTT